MGGYECGCPDGYTLTNDMRTCAGELLQIFNSDIYNVEVSKVK